jgi:pyruvate/2-oxoacid:ferredoxin oxidoreductase beta subunit
MMAITWQRHVAQVCMGANSEQTLIALREAGLRGPALIWPTRSALPTGPISACA